MTKRELIARALADVRQRVDLETRAAHDALCAWADETHAEIDYAALEAQVRAQAQAVDALCERMAATLDAEL